MFAPKAPMAWETRTLGYRSKSLTRHIFPQKSRDPLKPMGILSEPTGSVSHYFACGAIKNQYCRTNSGIAASFGEAF
jgi:hypothetical protein